MLFNTLTLPGCCAREHPQQGHRQHKAEEQRCCVAVLPSRETRTGWRIGLRKCLWSSTRVNGESCIWGPIAWGTQGRLEGWKTALWGGFGRPGGQAGEHKPSTPPPWQSKPRPAWTPLGTALPTSHSQHCCPKGLGSLHLGRYSKHDWKWS